jgi:cellulose biosynthesis protein BcsQ
MVHKIALFNHKGGVSKTTTTFNLGWMLASKGKKVILVDADPQCNLTGMVLGFSTKQELEELYRTGQNIKSGLEPAFKSQPKLIEAVDCIPVKGQEGLFILPGHIGLAEYDVDLGIAQNLSGAIQSLQNVPGAMSFLFQKTAEKCNADYILIDLSPSLGAINQNLVMTSNFLIIPTYPDLFSLMAIDSLLSILPKWYSWAVQASSLKILKEAYYPFPDITLQFLGTLVQNYKKDSLSGGIEVATKPFQKWIDAINEAVANRLVPSLRENNMMLPNYLYAQQGIDSNDFCLAMIADFGALITKSQEHKTPIFALTSDQLGWGGNLFSITSKSKEKFNDVFLRLAEKVINLTSDAVSH